MAPPNPVKITAKIAMKMANQCAGFISISMLEMAKLSRGKKMRKMTRKAGRKAGRRASRRRAMPMMYYGGGQALVPAGVNDASMQASSRLSLGQGNQYASLHTGQHGGAAVSLAAAAPPGYTGVLDSSLVPFARTGPTLASLNAAAGMQDGGGRRKKVKANHKKIMAMLKKLNKKMTRKAQRGGMPALTHAADYSSPGMLLSPSAERAALGAMNPEWRLASDPSAFAPKMY
jgi:hypothetical protein